MPLDPYSLCPGGREKKIRFCCSDMVKEIDQIERLLESNQGGACLSFIENLEKDHKDCACLTAAKLSVYRSQNRWDEALLLAKAFVEREPGNPVAASEYGLALAVTGNFKESMSVLVDAFELAKEGTAHSSLINATLQAGACMLMRGIAPPVVAIGNRLKMFPSVQEPANALLYRASSMVDIPLQLRDMMFDYLCPDDFPGKADYEDAVELITLMQWKKGLAKLESLVSMAPSWPTLWRNIAAVRFWLLENEAGCEALKTFAAMPGVSVEDAVDAETTCLYLTPDGLGDLTEVLYVEYPVTDAAKIQEILLSTPNFYFIEVNPAEFQGGDTPPPRAAFVILDRPFPKPDAVVTVDNISSQLGTCLIFGKETDREARLTLMELLADDRNQVESMLKKALGELIQDASKVETIRPISRSQTKVQYRFRYTPETLPTAETLQNVEKAYYDAHFTKEWSSLPLGLLDGKTPEEAAKDPKYKIRMLAAIQYIEYWMNEETSIEFTNRLRAHFGLPTLEPISVPDGTEQELLGVLDEQPIWRWYRFDVEKLPTPVLVEGLQIVAVMKEPRATGRFAKELLNRPIKSMPVEARAVAFESLVGISRGMNDLEDALLWIERAKNEAEECGITDAGWCLHEIPIRLGLGQFEKVRETIDYVIKKYGHDDNVMQGLHNLFIQLGILNSDGTPAAGFAQRAQQAAMAEQQAGASPQEGIWTPDGGGSAPVGNGGASKLWTPD